MFITSSYPNGSLDKTVASENDETSSSATKRNDFSGAEHPLENTAKSSGRTAVAEVAKQAADMEKQRVSRNARWNALGVLWEFSSLERVRSCGRWSIRPDNAVHVRQGASQGAAGYAGLASCGSVWACPRCSARILSERRLELGVLMAAAEAAGYALGFSTVTLRHKKGQSLSMLWDAVTKCYAGVGHSRKVRRMRDALNRVGQVRRFEVTHGDNGWHPHIHTIHLFDKEITQGQLNELADAEFAVWEAQAKKKGLGAPLRKNYDFKLVSSDRSVWDYFTKMSHTKRVEGPRKGGSIEMEMAAPMTKKGRRKTSREPFEILEDFRATGDLDDLDLWLEFEKVSKGKRLLVWSRDLKAKFGVGEVDDQEIAEREEGSDDDYLFSVMDWSPIARNSSLGGKLLGEVARGGLQAGWEFCLKHGIPVEKEK